MAIAIIDRRKNPKGKSLVNRQRFLKRHSRQMRDAIREKIRAAEVKTISSDQPTKVKIDIKATEQPVFHHRLWLDPINEIEIAQRFIRRWNHHQNNLSSHLHRLQHPASYLVRNDNLPNARPSS